MFDIHAYNVLFIFVDNSDLCESLAEVDRKKLGALIYATISREYSILNFFILWLTQSSVKVWQKSIGRNKQH